MASRHIIPTTFICGFPAIGKTFATKRFGSPGVIDFKEDTYRKICIEGNEEFINPAWPVNYIDALIPLANTEYYRAIFVAHYDYVRKGLRDAGIKYTNIVPEDTDKMKLLIIERCASRGDSEEFLKSLSENYSEWVNSMINDPGAITTIQLTPETIDYWFEWIAYC